MSSLLSTSLYFTIYSFQYSLTEEPEKRPFDPSKTALQEYPITSFQPVYFVADSFEDAKEKLRFVGKHWT